MCRALLCYLAQTWAADPHRQARQDGPAMPASQARDSRPSPRAPRRHGRLWNIGWRVPCHLVRPRT